MFLASLGAIGKSIFFDSTDEKELPELPELSELPDELYPGMVGMKNPLDEFESNGKFQVYHDEDKTKKPLEDNPKLIKCFQRSHDVSTRKDVLLAIPYEQGIPVNQTPISWYVGLDGSGSMNEIIQGKDISRWQIACILLNQVVQDLIKTNRHEDTITIVQFASSTKIICRHCSAQDFISQNIMQELTHSKPTGSTNIQLVNSVLHSLMLTDPSIVDNQARPVEIFLTDGEATMGLSTPAELRQQKTNYYQDLQTQLGIHPPFIWCGAISDYADWRTVQAISQASPLSLWAFIRDQEIADFATEIGGLVATATTFRLFYTSPNNVVMLLPDVDNMFYCQEQPINNYQYHPTEAIITLFKINQFLDTCSEHPDQPQPTIFILTHLLKTVEACNKTDDPILSKSVRWSTIFEQTKIQVIQTIRALIDVCHNSGSPINLERQMSSNRRACNSSSTVRLSARQFSDDVHL